MPFKSVADRSTGLHRWAVFVGCLWNRDFQDIRVIVEQRDGLRYYAIPATWQRRIARSAMVFVGLCFLTLFCLALLSAKLSVDKNRLENSHQEVFMALVGAVDSEGEEIKLSKQEMAQLARSIRERDIAIRRYIDNATTSIESENVSLQSRLNATGLTERAIKVIQQSTPIGGYSREREDLIMPLLDSSFGEQSSANRALKEILSALPDQLPVNDHILTSPFGIRKHPIHGTPRLHAGIDLISRSDDKVLAAKAGTVILARSYNDYGNTVIVRHERGIETLYAHLSTIDVKVGQEVDLETVLGKIGNTGASTGKHLHFEVSVAGYPVDPLKVINLAEYVQQAKK